MSEKWFGQKCEFQICKYEKDGNGEEDLSEPVLIYCKHNENKDDHEGNCNLRLCPICDKGENNMDSRKAMKITLDFLFEKLLDEKGIEFTEKEKTNAIELMHDDDIFITELIDFMEDHIDMFGENYGLD